MADEVISLKVILFVSISLRSFLFSKSSLKCHAIASPSLSGSVARYTQSTSLHNFLNSLIVFLPLTVSCHLRSVQSSGFTASSLSGKSLIWPKQASTFHSSDGKFLFKYPVILVAFAPDSTMTKFFILF